MSNSRVNYLTTMLTMPPKIILASSSPYRRALLKKINIHCHTASPGIDESMIAGESPQHMALRLAQEKANSIKSRFPNHLIIASDQVAMLGAEQLKKPGNHENTINQLQLISGKIVNFYTSISVLNSRTDEMMSDLDSCSVQFRALSGRQITNYVDLERPSDCAGGFKSEGLGIALISNMKGDDPNALVGLPLIKLIRILERFGIKII